MEITRLLIATDRVTDFVPILSTVTNLVNLFIKTVVLPLCSKETISKNHYFNYLNDKDSRFCIILAIPIYGTIGAIFLHHFSKYNKLTETKREFVLAEIQKGHTSEFDQSFADDKEVVIAAVSRNVYLLEKVSERLRKDKDVLLAAVVTYTPSEYDPKRDLYPKENLDIVFKVNPSINDDTDFILKVVELINSKFSKYKKNEMIRKLVAYASERLKDDKDFMLALLKCYHKEYGLHELIDFASPRLKGDKDFMVTTIKSSVRWIDICRLIGFSCKKLKGERDFMVEVLNFIQNREPFDLFMILPDLFEKIASEELLNDKDLMLSAAKIWALDTLHAMKKGGSKILDDKEIILEAIQAHLNQSALWHNKKLTNDEKLKFLNDFAGEKLKNDPDFSSLQLKVVEICETPSNAMA